MSKRIGWIDIAKGFGIIFVVTGHYITSNWPFILYIFSFHMPLFFYISGAVLAERKTNASNRSTDKLSIYARKKWKALIRPYFVASLLSILLHAVSTPEEGVVQKLIDTVTLRGTSVFWFLPALFIASIFFELYNRFANSLPARIIIFLIAAIIPPVFGKPLYSSDVSSVPLYICISISVVLLRGLWGFAFILIGNTMHTLYLRIMSNKSDNITGRLIICVIATLCFILLAFFSQLNFTNMRELKTDNIPLFYLNSIIGCIAVSLLSLGIGNCKPLAYLGENSLIIMMIHLDFYIFNVSRRLADLLYSFIPFSAVYYLIMSITVIILLWLGCLILNPWLKKLQNI